MASIALKKKTNIDMTEGGIASNLLKFAMPLLLGNLFQQLYNMVDTYIIGQTNNNSAYAAVGSVGPIINILLGFFLGLSSGASVVISQYYGAKDEQNVKKSTHTALAMTLILSVIFTILGIIAAPRLVTLMLKGDNQSELYGFATKYLTIYFAGVTGLMIYNIGAGILRAIGDSTRPVYFLVFSAVTNTVLDVVFVFALNLGVAGVAIATVISQIGAAVLVIITLLRSDTWVKLSPKELKLDKNILLKIVKIGIPAGFQMALTSFSNIFVQSYVSGANAPVGMSTDEAQALYLGSWTTYSKVDTLLFLPMQSLSVAGTTFVGQNLGAGNIKRAKRGAVTCYLITSLCTAILMLPIIFFAPFIARVFNSDVGVVQNAAMLLRCITPFYLLCCINQIFSGALRGAGKTTAPMIIMLTTFVGVRQAYLFVMSNYISNDFLHIAFGYPLGWACCATLTLLYFFRCDFSKCNITKREIKQ